MIKNLNENDCIQFLSENCIGHLSYISNDVPYVVPITYFFDENEKFICYSNEGHKLNALRKNKHASLCVTKVNNFNDWKSVQAVGLFEEIFGSDAKLCLHEFANGLKNIVKNTKDQELNFVNPFSKKTSTTDIPVVFKIHLTKLNGKIEMS